ncbi:LysR family transcriptional regulator [Sciscionella sediminilitoris]|uniref:LysR family transcriptional regulator n=1 Tax=Sciscionella sediminilitoris TaxID=1445613 RepID=UPI0004DFC09C|nr:LysR family transcriptional regulator [Sciscionella sp. SE31]
MRDFDLNLVRTFVLLYETRSVTATAESLHLTQPTVSYALQKLRRRFGDELFRRSGAGLVPTTTARDLYEPLHTALAGIESTVSDSVSFDPATAQTAFTLCLSDLGEVSLLPPLLAAIKTRAPGVTFTVHPLDVSDVEGRLGRGEIDAFIATPLISSRRVERVPLFREGHVALVAEDHPRLRGSRISQAQFEAERHVTVVGPAGHDGPRRALELRGLTGRIALQVTRYSSLPYLVQRTELVGMAPRRLAEVWRDENRVRLLELPFELEPIVVSAYARRTHSRSPAQQWLVDFMQEVLG